MAIMAITSDQVRYAVRFCERSRDAAGTACHVPLLLTRSSIWGNKGIQAVIMVTRPISKRNMSHFKERGEVVIAS